MPDFLKSGPEILTPVPQLLLRLVASLVLGVAVAFVYRRTRPRGEVLASFPPTLVLLSILIAMVTQVVGDNAARAFSLLGALSVVRFRTVVRDAQDTAYVIFAVVVGMAAGAASFWVAGFGFLIVSAAAFSMRPPKDAAVPLLAVPLPYLLRVRVGLGHDPKVLLQQALDTYVTERRLHGIETAKQGISIDVTYEVQLRSAQVAEDFVRSLNRLEGVQDVRLQRREIMGD
jgi:uncharacterized membrane protein YhiD involved in acid resistance